MAGYRYDSIHLNMTAGKNKIGECIPERILVDGLERLKIHRLFLAQTYGPMGKFPLTTQGNPVLVEDVMPNFTIQLKHFTVVPDEQGLHHVSYHITPLHENEVPDLSRIDLVVGGVTVQSKIGTDLTKDGEFTFRHKDYDQMNGAYVVGLISAWDHQFNCVNTPTEFFIPPAGCED